MVKLEIITQYKNLIKMSEVFSGLAPLLFRLVLAPVMIVAGYNKLGMSGDYDGFLGAILADPSVVQWMGNSEWGLGLPFPDLMAFLAGWTEFLGGFLILFGLLTRVIAIPLMFTMVIAATSVHWDSGWSMVTPTSGKTSPALFFDWVGFDSASKALEESAEAADRLSRIRSILEEHGNTNYLYQHGTPVLLNNGIEFAAIYFIMFLSLFFTGGGRYTSIDYWLERNYNKNTAEYL